ncbi:MAG TPA: ferredoxin-type protein NapG [Parasulfuritortus sp.]
MSDSVSRRDFMVKAAQGAALAATGGLLWAYLLRQEAKAQPYALRPPGALAEKDFEAACIKCGQCVNACPPDILKLAPAGGDLPIGTPYFTPRSGACIMCPDIPCLKACPTGALAPELKDINQARMGLAVIDIENCLSWKGLRCEICYRDCPIRGKAIRLETDPRGLSKHAMFRPIVNSDACTGCGICEHSCPTELAAIRILPRNLVQGRIGEHYKIGWQDTGKITEDFKPAASAPEPPKAPDGNAPGVDYLNQGGL